MGYCLGWARLTNAIKNTLKHNATVIRVNLNPVGYSIPSPLVMTLVNSSCTSFADLTFLRSSSPSLLCGGAEEDDLESGRSLVCTGACSYFSSRLGEVPLSVGAVDSPVVYFSSDMFAVVATLL